MPSLDPDTFRSVLGRFASGVTIVTATDGAGRNHGMTVSAFCSLSLTPPLILACIDRSASMNNVLLEPAHFVANILATQQEALSRRFSTPDAAHRFDGIGFSRSSGGAPVLDEVLASLECHVVARYEEGDHTIIVGHVDAATSADDRPLLYYRGGYAQLER